MRGLTSFDCSVSSIASETQGANRLDRASTRGVAGECLGFAGITLGMRDRAQAA